MPIYEYACGACGHELEALQKISDAPLTHCPSCNKETLQKLISAAGFQLKGTGWYATDFKNSGKKPETKSSHTDAPKTSDSSSSSTDTKADK